MIGKDERRDVSIRRPRPSIRKQLTDSKQAASPKKAAARTKKKEMFFRIEFFLGFSGMNRKKPGECQYGR